MVVSGRGIVVGSALSVFGGDTVLFFYGWVGNANSEEVKLR